MYYIRENEVGIIECDICNSLKVKGVELFIEIIENVQLMYIIYNWINLKFIFLCKYKWNKENPKFPFRCFVSLKFVRNEKIYYAEKKLWS